MVDGKADSSPTEDERIEQFTQDVAPFTGLTISIEDDITDASYAEFFSGVREKRKEIEEWFDEIESPLKAALNVLRNKKVKLLTPLELLETDITSARKIWFLQKAESVRLKNKQAITDAKETGGVVVLEKKPDKTVHTSSGAAVGWRSQPSWRLTDDNEITAKKVEADRLKFNRADPRLKNVPDEAFYLIVGMIQPLLKTGAMPEGEHSIEKFDDLVPTNK